MLTGCYGEAVAAMAQPVVGWAQQVGRKVQMNSQTVLGAGRPIDSERLAVHRIGRQVEHT